MALTFYWRCEASALDGTHDYSAGDTTGTDVNSPSYTTGARLVGTSGTGLLIDADEKVTFAPASIVTASAGTVAFWFQCTDFGLDDNRTFFTVNDSGGGSDTIRLRLEGASGAANVVLYTDYGEVGTQASIATVGANLASGSKYFVVASWDDSANDRRIAVYNSSGVLIDDTEDTSTAFSIATTSPDTIIIGNNGAYRGYYDNVFIGNAYADSATFLEKRNIESYTEYAGTSIVPKAMANYRMRAA
jgi:hypothetical protein